MKEPHRDIDQWKTGVVLLCLIILYMPVICVRPEAGELSFTISLPGFIPLHCKRPGINTKVITAHRSMKDLPADTAHL